MTRPPTILRRLAHTLAAPFREPSDPNELWPAEEVGPRPRASAADARRRASAFLDERRRTLAEQLRAS